MNEGVFMIEIRYEKIYNQFIENYKEIHVNPWHEISEEELRKIYDTLLSSMDVNNEYSFKYFMDYIIKRLNGTTDAHTKYEAISAIPMNFRMFGDEILINYPEDLKNSKLIKNLLRNAFILAIAFAILMVIKVQNIVDNHKFF